MIPFAVADLRTFFEGPWRLSRSIDDRRNGQRGRLEGSALFAPEGATLIYRENGMLRLGSHRGRTAQTYRFDFPDPIRAAVGFSDGSPFYELDLTSGSCTVEHRCRDDLYHGAFRLLSGDTWEVVWQVSGPRKDHEILSRYGRK